MSCWDNPEDRRKCIIDAIGIAVISSLISGSIGLLLGLYLATV